MKNSLFHKPDFYAGALMMLFGLFAALKAPEYRLGTLMHMGPGFLPTALGVVLTLLGLVILGTAITTVTPEGESEHVLPANPQWFGWLCVIAGPLAFILFGKIGGMIPATFACVFVSALGDRTATLKSSLTLAAVVTVFGTLLFHYLLKMPMPMLKWSLQ